MRSSAITPEFVEFIPKDLSAGVLYISQKYHTAVHHCLCGCGRKVVTPLSVTDWQLTVRGGRVSLYPSIGNWSSPCRSHYWIANNKVEWSTEWSDARVAASRANDKALKESHYRRRNHSQEAMPAVAPGNRAGQIRSSWWDAIKRLFD